MEILEIRPCFSLQETMKRHISLLE